MDSLRILRCWAACAWADGVLHSAERAALERFIEASEDLSSEDLYEARRYLSGPTDLDVAEVESLPAESREGVYRAALAIVKLDREITDDERAFLAKLRTLLELDAATIERIDAE